MMNINHKKIKNIKNYKNYYLKNYLLIIIIIYKNIY